MILQWPDATVSRTPSACTCRHVGWSAGICCAGSAPGPKMSPSWSRAIIPTCCCCRKHRRDFRAAVAGGRPFLPPSHADAHLWPGGLEPASLSAHHRHLHCPIRCCRGGCRRGWRRSSNSTASASPMCISATANSSTASSLRTSPSAGRARRHHRRFQCRGSDRASGLLATSGPRKRTHAPATSSRSGSTAAWRAMCAASACGGAGQGPVRPSPHPARTGARGERASRPRGASVINPTRRRRSSDKHRRAKPTGVCPRRSAF